MTFNCPICFETLVTPGETVSALGCGHTYHKDCITRWFANSNTPQCPLCKKVVSRNKIISPVFFSSSEAPVTLSADSPEVLERLKKMEEKNNSLTAGLASLNKEAGEYRKEIKQLKLDLNRVRNQRSYVKMIKRVAELDNDMSEEYMQEYMKKIKTFEIPNLYVHVGALRARQMQAERDIAKITSKYQNKDKENEGLRDKIDQLHRHIQKIESNRNLPTSLTERKKGKRPQNVIILDSDIEDEGDNDDSEESNVAQTEDEGDDDNNEELNAALAEDEGEGSSSKESEVQQAETPEDYYTTSFVPEEESFVVEEHVATAKKRSNKRSCCSSDQGPSTKHQRKYY